MERPNILIFMTDQQQAQVALPEHPCRMPNLDKLTAAGVSFTHAYPPMAHCSPARASLMTGLYPSQHGVYNNVSNEPAIRRSLKPGVETFAEKLRAAGYRMYFSGKWHVSAEENPCDRGWEELLVKAGSGDHMGTSREKWIRDTPKYMAEKNKTERAPGEILRPGWGHKLLYGTSKQQYQELSDYKAVRKGIEQLNVLKETQEPWCLYIGVTGPHDPFIIPEKYAKMYNPDDIPLPPNYHDDLKDKPGVYRRMRKIFAQLTEREVKESIAHYWGFCTMQDDMFGEVMDALKNNGQLDNTMVIFLSDHGEHCGAHGLYCKGISSFDEGYRVPLVISWPGRIEQPGRRVDEFVTLMDIAPTLIEATGARPLGKCSGQSLLPFLKNERPADWRDTLFAQCNGVEVYYTSRMIRTKKYKFVYHATDIDELYDLENDPYELRNVADEAQMKNVKEMMYLLMWDNAFRYEDTIFNPYITVATADIGPGVVYGRNNDNGMGAGEESR